jgi:hypothetical protein
VQEVFGGGMYQDFEPEAVGAELADIWLRGVTVPVMASGAKTNGNGHTSKNGGKSSNGRNGRNGKGKEK